jgi:pilus assembly protein CpaE
MPPASAENIRLLIVDDIAETRENLRKLLQFESDIEVVGAARTGEEALQMARDTQPDVVLMDINMPDMDGISATKTLLEDVPFAQIVILSVQNDADYMRRAMLAGARDFIAKPPSGDELIATVRLVSTRSKEMRIKLARPVQPVGQMPGSPGFSGSHRPEGKAIVVYSAKGGVGCTTLATNLAIGLNAEETPTVLVDANMQFGDVSVFLNLQVKNSFVDLASRAEEIESELVEEILMRHESGLRVLAAPPRPEMAEEIHAEQVRKVLQYLKRNFAYVVVDTSRALDDVTLAVLDVADVLVAVATPEIPAIKDARLLFDILIALEFPRDRVFFVLNKMDRKSGITAEAVSENLKRPVDGEIPVDEKAVGASINRGVPLLMGDRSKPPARNILELVATLKQRLLAAQPEEAEPREAERPRLFNR